MVFYLKANGVYLIIRDSFVRGGILHVPAADGKASCEFSLCLISTRVMGPGVTTARFVGRARMYYFSAVPTYISSGGAKWLARLNEK